MHLIWSYITLGIFVYLRGYGLPAGDIKYFLYNTTNPDVPIELELDVNRAKYSINPEGPIKILCHGANDDSNSFWYAPTRDAYLTKEGGTVIFIDWRKHAYGMYPFVTLKAQAIGEHIADQITQISESLGIPLDRFHLIGHSLGCHLLGFAGKKIFRTKGQKVGRITALDPAGPLFDNTLDDNHLCKRDAVYVDVVHTSAALHGYKTSMGHADFWPNGGFVQKGCSLTTDCSHFRAPIFFIESINCTDFAAWECGSFQDFKDEKCFRNKQVVMGDKADPKYEGNFYLNTAIKSPYAIPKF